MSLTLYNTLTRKKEALETYVPSRGKLGLYVCGPTVYDEPHIGHARSAFVFDILRRYLKFREYPVVFVRNVTDVDDKIIERARKEGGDLKQAVQKISEHYLFRYQEDMGKLGILPPTVEPKATEYIPQMQKMIQEIIASGAAYAAGGDVYFSVKKAKNYGKLSGRNVEEMLEGTRGEPPQNKQDPLDFALWKSAKPEEPSWDSPWGKGRPGWHIECSAMSTEIFTNKEKEEWNAPFVIHGGGLDLIFPHHENEIAQADGAGRDFAKIWVHNGLVTVNAQKMSKSLGNFITLGELFQKAEPEVVRFYFLQTHYQNPLDFSWEKLEEAKTAYQRFQTLTDRVRRYERELAQKMEEGGTQTDSLKFHDKFVQAMDDDLNTPEALAVLFSLLNYTNGILSDQKSFNDPQKILDFIAAGHDVRKMGKVFGLFEKEPITETVLNDEEKSLVEEREEARKGKDFKTADAIRRKLLEQGLILEDTAGGVIWRRVQ
ncbi:MAG: cysteine--tRNA ligase [Candidatus Omnitrophota bacterium]